MFFFPQSFFPILLPSAAGELLAGDQERTASLLDFTSLSATLHQRIKAAKWSLDFPASGQTRELLRTISIEDLFPTGNLSTRDPSCSVFNLIN